MTWGFLKLGVSFLGVPMIRTVGFGGLCWGPPASGNYHVMHVPVVQESTSLGSRTGTSSFRCGLLPP